MMPIQVLLCPLVFLIARVTAIGYAWMGTLYYTLHATFHSWEPRRVGLAYLGTAVGVLVGMIVGGLLDTMIVIRRARKGDGRPETRLVPTIFFCPFVGIGLLVYA
jgi:hypothetical protein